MMKKTTLALAISAATMAATPAFATNGDHLIGLGAKSRALGGTGIAAFYGAESALVNPALLAKGKGNEISFAGTIFKPSVKVSQQNIQVISGTQKVLTGSATSAADMSVIPEVAIMNPINEQLTFGIGIFGTAGMGVDFRGSSPINSSLNQARTNLQLMKFAPSLAFNGANWGLGASLAVMYGSLDIGYETGNPAQKGGHSGVSDDYGLGWQIGGYFDLSNNLTLAAMYQSAISMKYKGQIANAAKDFQLSNRITSDTLEQPATLGLGVNYAFGNISIAADYKRINWSSATGYKQFGWDDQNIIALGAQYKGNGYWLGVGYNRGDNPVKKDPTGTPDDYSLNRLNYLMFPGIVEQHWTLGGGYRLTKTMSVDVAMAYAPEVYETVKQFYSDGMNNNSFTLTTKHSQVSYTVSLRYDF